MAGGKKGDAWCAGFVFACYFENGVKTTINMWAPTAVPTSRAVWERGANLGGKTPQPGDAFGIYYASLKRIGHVGLVEVWGDGPGAQLIEGNTNAQGSREGNQVARRIRPKATIRRVCSWL